MWNPAAPEIIENPFPFWAWLRREAPVWEVPDAGYFTISRYTDVMEVSRDSETFSSELLAVVQRDDSGRARLQKTELVGRPQSRVLGDGWSKLRDAPDSVAPFIEEAIRLDGPAVGNLRRTTRATEVAGVKLPEGSTVALLWGSANRDESEFPDPDRFVIDRPNIKTHLGFGLGKHFCLGAALARMETRVALQALLAKKERVSLAVDADSLRHKRTVLGVRRLRSLPIKLG